MKWNKISKILCIIFLIIVAILIVLYLFIRFYPGIGRLPDKAQKQMYMNKTNLYYDNQFHNSKEVATYLGNEHKAGDDVELTPKSKIPVIKLSTIESAKTDSMTITWLGHSSSLLQIHRLNVLIDPIMKEYASPVNFIGAKRFSDIPIEPENLPNIDIVLISHADYDHLDYETIKKIDSKVKMYVVPLGIESYLMGWGIDENKICSLSWWDETNIDGVQVTLTPAQHYTTRNPLGFNSTWWGGFVLKDEYHSFYYSGDSGYGDFFKEVYKKYGEIELFLSDTGQYDDAWPNVHMNPKDALQAAEDVHAMWQIPVHWGAFVLGNHAWDEPPKLLRKYAENSNVNIATPMIGEKIDYKNIADYQKDWWNY